MQAEVLFTQKEEREHALSSHNLKSTTSKSGLKKSPSLKSCLRTHQQNDDA
jgi:hypothetical protein